MLARTLALVTGTIALSLAAQGAPLRTPIAPAVHLHAPVAPNPHLHGFTTISSHAAPKMHAEKTAAPTLQPPLHHPWANGWNVAVWRTSHISYGEVRGTIVDPAGHPLPGRRVWLRYPGGHPVHHSWEAHVVHADAAGHFVMRHVIAKDYRLCVKDAKNTIEHMQIAVARGTVTFEHFVFN